MHFHYWKYFVTILIIVPLCAWLILQLTAYREAARRDDAPSRIRQAEIGIWATKEVLAKGNPIDEESLASMKRHLDSSSDDLEAAQNFLSSASESKQASVAITDWVTAIGGIVTAAGAISTIVLSWRKDVREAQKEQEELKRLIIP